MLKLNNYDYESSAKQIATSDEKFFSDCQMINGLSVEFIFAIFREALWWIPWSLLKPFSLKVINNVKAFKTWLTRYSEI